MSGGNRHLHSNELGLVTTNTGDALNRLVATAFPDGTTVSNRYDRLDVVGVKDRLNQWTLYGFNPVRQLTAITYAGGQVTQVDYCGCGSPATISRANGTNDLITQFFYHLSGKLTNTIYPDGYQVLRGYYGDRLAQLGDNAGRQISVAYARFGIRYLVQDVTDSAAHYLMHRDFDERGNVLLQLDRNGTIVTNAYDALDRLVARQASALYTSDRAGLETFLHDAKGLVKYTDPLGKETAYARDSLGRILFETNANSEVLKFTYNPAGQILTLKDGKDQQTARLYCRH
jgi:YD repeat-containing protein